MGIFDIFGKKNRTTSNDEQKKLNEKFDKLNHKLSSDLTVQEEQKAEQRQQEDRMMNDIYGRIQQFNNAPGVVRADKVAVEEAQRFAEKIGIQNVDSKQPQLSLAEQQKLEREEFDRKLPQYEKLKKIISDKQADVISLDLSKRLDIVVKMCKERYPEFNLNDLLIPYMKEKQARGLTELSETMALSNYTDNAMLDGYSQREIAERTLYYITMNGALFGLEESAFKNFYDSFEYSVPSLYYMTQNELQETSKSSSPKR